MKSVFDRNQKAFRSIAWILFYCMALIPSLSNTTMGAILSTEKKTNLTAQEKQNLVKEGVDAYKQGDREQAQESLESASRVFPENYVVPYYLGLIYLEQGKRSAAIDQWQKYVAMDPQSNNALRIRKNLTLLLREEARESAKIAVANEATLVGAPADDNTVAISTFNNLGSEKIDPLGKGMAALLIHDLSLIPDLQVVERVKLQTLLEEMKLGTSGLVTAESAPKVGKLLKAKHVTSGSLADLEKENLQIASALVDADQITSISTQEAQGKLKRFYELEKDIACQIVEDLGKNCDEAPAAFHEIHTMSLAALLFFAAGLDFLDKQDYDKARESFQKALDEDSSFELAQNALWDTPVPGMQFMKTSTGAAAGTGLGTTDEMIAMAAFHGVSSDAAGTGVVTGSAGAEKTGRVGFTPLTGIVGGAVLIGGAALAAGGGGDGGGSSSGGGGTTTGTGQCNQQQIAGGDTADQRSIEMGQNAGTFDFFYQTFSIQDRIIVSYEGNQLFDTQCVGASDTVTLSYSGNSSQIIVQVQPNCTGNTSGTAWNYTVNCP